MRRGAPPLRSSPITSQGLTAWVDAQLSPLTAVPDTDLETLVNTQWPLLRMAILGVHDRYYPNSTGDLGYAAVQAYLARAIWSTRQLLEVMVDFWTNHLVVTGPWGEAWDSVHRYQLDVIRTPRAGPLRRHARRRRQPPGDAPAARQRRLSKRAPNENFGRELLELHTVGVDGGYTESDVRMSALVLTGMSTDESGEYLWCYNPHRRDAARQVLGWSDPNPVAEDGVAGRQSYLTYLAQHPATANRIARKLAVRYVSDTPPATLVDEARAGLPRERHRHRARAARALPVAGVRRVGGPEGAHALRGRPRLVPRPRPDAPGADVRRATCATSSGALGSFGQAPMGWPAPNGYPDVAAAWNGASSTLNRWNFHLGLAGNWTAKAMARPAVTTSCPPRCRARMPPSSTRSPRASSSR